jgi:hypothetical protein
MNKYSQGWSIAIALGLLGAGLAANPALADSKENARAIFARTKDAVIHVSAVVKVEIPGRGSEGQPVETTCTVIGADGLAVVSSTALNPVAAALDSLADMNEEQRPPVAPKVELTQVKYRLADATEVPARLVYKDKDLDLAFLVPDLKEGEKAPKFSYLEVKDGPKAQELDDFIAVKRLAKNMSYTPAVSIGHIVAVVTKPRTVYDFALEGTPGTGTPIFTSNGDLLGFTLLHQDGGGGEMAVRAMLAGAGEIVILPAGEVAGLIDQARKAAAKKEPKEDSKDSKPQAASAETEKTAAK